MANEINSVPALKPEMEKPIISDTSDNPESVEHKKVERNADRAANKANQTQQRYEDDHTTFSI